MVSFELGKEIDKEKRGTKKKVCVPTRKRTSDLRIPLYDALPLSPRESTAGEIYYEVHMTHGDSEFFFLCHAHDKTKNIFIYFFAELKIYHLSYCINKYDTIDIADPSSMQDACHMNFVIDLAHHSLEHRSAASEGPRSKVTSLSISLPSSKFTISLIVLTNMTLSTLPILAVCRTRVI